MYQFDLDYREFGGPARIVLEAATTNGGYSEIVVDDETAMYTDTNVDGAHRSIQFIMPDDARVTGDDNFRIWLGQTSGGLTKKSTSVYFANVSLKACDDSTDNIFMNGGFYFGKANEDITTANSDTNLFGWTLVKNNAGNPYITTYAKRCLMDIPDGFFADNDNIGDDATKVIKFTGTEGYAVYRFDAELEPSSNYELSYNYRVVDDMLNGLTVQGPDDSASISVADQGITHENGKFTKKYTITTTDAFHSYSDNDSNTRFLFNFGKNSTGKEFAISNVQLHKVEDGSLVGVNIVGDINPIYADAIYSEASNEFTVPGNQNGSMVNDIGHGWFAGRSDASGAKAYVIKVNEHYFDYLTPAQRVSGIINAILGRGTGYNAYNDTTSFYFDPNGDGSKDILDLVKVKREVASIGDEGGAAVEAATLQNKIMNAADVGESGTVVKIAKTDTTSTLKSKLNNAASGSKVLLERGGEWRIPSGEDGFVLKSGVTLGAYGTGAKPILNGSQKNYTGSSTWTNVSGNIWKTRITSSVHDANVPGTVYFFNSYNDANPAIVGRIIANNARFTSTSDLTKEGDVYYAPRKSDGYDGYVYVYSTSNPGTKYGRIEIGEKRDVLTLSGNNTVDNICVKFGGGHGISALSKSNITISNSEIAYIGGTVNGTDTMGNGIQFGNGGSNLTVKNCYVHECYDAGITFQSYSSSSTTFDGVYFKDNLLTNNFYNIEFFTTGTPANKSGSGTVDGTMKNIEISGNIMRFAGECWSYEQRQGDQLRCANICVTQGAYYVNTSNLKIQNNIFDCTMVQQIFWTWGELDAHKDKTTHVGVTISDNVYYQKAGSSDSRVNRWGNVNSDQFDSASSTQALRTAVEKFDTNPTKVEFVNRAKKF